MTDAWRLLVAGSRYFSSPQVIRTEFRLIQAEHPDSKIVLVHGMCDPRDNSRRMIPWVQAERYPPGRQAVLLGADWLCDVIARDLGWETERHPADWAAPCQPACQPEHRRPGRSGTYCPVAGMRRNHDIAELGADEMVPFLEPGEANAGTYGCMAACREAGIPVRKVERCRR